MAALKAATAAALVLAAEAVTALKADDTNGGNGSVAVVGCASLAAGGRLINLFHCLFVVNIIILPLLGTSIVIYHGVSQSLLFSETRD